MPLRKLKISSYSYQLSGVKGRPCLEGQIERSLVPDCAYSDVGHSNMATIKI